MAGSFHGVHLHAEVRTRIHVGPWVIDEEHVTGIQFEGFPPALHAQRLSCLAQQDCQTTCSGLAALNGTKVEEYSMNEQTEAESTVLRGAT